MKEVLQKLQNNKKIKTYQKCLKIEFKSVKLALFVIFFVQKLWFIWKMGIYTVQMLK